MRDQRAMGSWKAVLAPLLVIGSAVAALAAEPAAVEVEQALRQQLALDESTGHIIEMRDKVDLSVPGYNGNGIVVSNIDTGVRTTHNALKPHHRGWDGTFFVGGLVTAAGHLWPLWARIDITAGTTPVATLYTSPWNGYYEVELPNGVTYDFTVHSMYAGYADEVRPVTVASADQVQNFTLLPGPSCSAGGYVFNVGTPVFAENWDSVTAPALPAGWATVDTSGTEGDWVTRTSTRYPGGYQPHTPPNLVFFNSFSAPSGDATRLYRTSGVDLSSGDYMLSFWMFHDTGYAGDFDRVQVQVSTDGGATWQDVGAPFDRRGTSDAWQQHTLMLTGFAGPRTDVRLGFLATSAYGSDIHLDELAIVPVSCDAVPGSMVAGFVSDGNTAQGLVGAGVAQTAPAGPATVTMAATGNLPAGFYYMFSPAPVVTAPEGPSTRTFTASKTGYGTVSQQIILVPDTVNRLDFALPQARLSLEDWPFVIDGRLTPDGAPAWDKTDSFGILNSGGLPAEAKVFAVQLGSGYVPPMPREPAGPLTMAPEIIAKNPTSLRGVTLNVPARPPAAPWAAGDVLASWPTGLALPWGCGVTGDTVWASNPSAGGGDDYDYEFTAAGAPTGRKVQAPFGGSWGADMTRADNAGMLWQVNVGGDNCIYELNPNSGATGNKICPAFGTSMRGLAYDPDTDTFFAGSWNDDTVYRFDRSGAILQSLNVGLAIAGLAYNPATGHLFVMVNDTPNPVWVLDVNNNYAALGSFTIAGFDDYSGAGIEFGRGGLWAMNQHDGKAYLVDAGEAYPYDPNLPWFVMTPTEGTVPASGRLDIGAEFLPEGVASTRFGLFRAVVKSTNDSPAALPDIPVYFTRAYWDVPRGHWADAFIHALAGVRITHGCGGGNFCPESTLNRAEMAILMVRAMHGPDFAPPPAVGVFVDVPISDTDRTADFIEQLYNDGVVAGCMMGSGGELYYCPNDLVNRAQMSVFICAGLGISPVDPPTHYFTDLAGYEWAEGYIEAIYNEGITAGCDVQMFCPGQNITRAQLAVWLTDGLGLPYYVHPMGP